MALLERDASLDILAALLTRTRRAPGHLVLVTGEAGIGKTSLVEAFVADHARGAQVLWGSCDPVTPARPFAPLLDFAERAGGALQATLRAADRDAVFDAFLTLLRRPVGSSRVIVFDDVHWADAATIDLLRVVGRRLRELPVLLIATYRDHEVGMDHPLRLLLGDLPAGAMTEMDVRPLSVDAVATLSGAGPVDARALHAATGGNPFFVTEVIASGSPRLPSTVRDAVNARVSRLSAEGRRVIRTASVLGQRTELVFLQRVVGRPHVGIDEALGRGMLEMDGNLVSFRHELARQAVLDSLAPDERAAMHAQALDVVRSTDRPRDPAAIAHHAAEAGDVAAVLGSAPDAGRRAAALGAHREAAAHFETALRFGESLDDSSRADLLEAHARALFLMDATGRAIASQRAALECWRRIGDPRREAACLCDLSLMDWFAGAPDEAMQCAMSAVAVAESISPPGPELARAYATLAQRRLVAGSSEEEAKESATQALALAEGLGEERTAVHALTTIGVAEVYMGREEGIARIDESLRRAMAAGLEDETIRASINLVEAARDLRRYDLAYRYGAEALSFVADRDLDLFRGRLLIALAEVDLERGAWKAAAEQAALILADRRAAAVLRMRGLIVLGRVQTRRGDHDPWPALDEAVELAKTGEIQELVPAYAARAEAAWIAGDPERTAAEAQKGIAVTGNTAMLWLWGELTFWAWRAGAMAHLEEPAGAPYILHAEGRYREAAAAWRTIGCPYQEAFALSESADEADLRAAFAIFQRLGASPAMAIVTRHLREIGARAIPRGPRVGTRVNPAGLTDRELEILTLLAEGLRNSQIADRLVISARTVDHHVSAVLRKLDVPDRAAAAAIGRTIDARKDRDTATAR